MIPKDLGASQSPRVVFFQKACHDRYPYLTASGDCFTPSLTQVFNATDRLSTLQMYEPWSYACYTFWSTKSQWFDLELFHSIHVASNASISCQVWIIDQYPESAKTVTGFTFPFIHRTLFQTSPIWSLDHIFGFSLLLVFRCAFTEQVVK